LAPLVLIASTIELVGLSAVIPFLTLLTDPAAFASLPIVGALTANVDLHDGKLLTWAGIGLAVAVLATNGVLMASRYHQAWVTRSLEHTISARLLRHYLAQGWAFMLTQSSVTLTNNATNGVNRVTNAIGSGLSLLSATVSIAAVVAFLVALEPLLATASFGLLGGIYGLVYLRVRTYLTVTGREAMELQRERLRAITEAIGAFRELKLSGREAFALRKFARPGKRYAELQARVPAVIALPRLALEGIAVAGAVVATTVIAGRDGSFASTLPILGAYVFGALRLMPAMQQVFAAFAGLRNAAGAVERVERDLWAARDAPERAVEGSPQRFERDIVLTQVHYRYPNGETDALRGIDVTLSKGSSLALVGATGSGKSTLAAVLLGLLEPTPSAATWRSASPTKRSTRRQCAAPASSRRSTPSSRVNSRMATTRCLVSGGCASPAGSDNGSGSPERSTTSPRCWCSTRRRAHSTSTPSSGCSKRCMRSRGRTRSS
jgi:ABC-type multidrug transport system fused ATPase/permease subunit